MGFDDQKSILFIKKIIVIVMSSFKVLSSGCLECISRTSPPTMISFPINSKISWCDFSIVYFDLKLILFMIVRGAPGWLGMGWSDGFSLHKLRRSDLIDDKRFDQKPSIKSDSLGTTVLGLGYKY